MNRVANRPEIDAEAVCRIVVKAREFAAKEDVVEAEPGSNPADEQLREVLADYPDDPVYDELKSFIDDMDVDARCELVALSWIGRGDFRPDEWGQALAVAHQEHTEHTAEYLLGTPLLADYLEEGLAKFGLSCLGFEKEHLRSPQAAIRTSADGDRAQPGRVLARDRARPPRGQRWCDKVRPRTLTADGPRRRSTCIGVDWTLGNPKTIGLRPGWTRRPPEISSNHLERDQRPGRRRRPLCDCIGQQLRPRDRKSTSRLPASLGRRRQR